MYEKDTNNLTSPLKLLIYIIKTNFVTELHREKDNDKIKHTYRLQCEFNYLLPFVQLKPGNVYKKDIAKLLN